MQRGTVGLMKYLRSRLTEADLVALRERGNISPSSTPALGSSPPFVPDAHALEPNWETDEEFGLALRRASSAGVALYAYTCSLTLQAIDLHQEIPVLL